MAHDVFISYSSHDKPIADAVCANLESKRIRCWIAPRDVLPGTAYGEALSEALRASRVLVLIWSAQSNESKHVMREVESAVDKGIPIVPFRIADVQPSRSLDFFLKAIHWLDAITPPLEKHLHTLADTVQLLLERQQQHQGEDKNSIILKLPTNERATHDYSSQRTAKLWLRLIALVVTLSILLAGTYLVWKVVVTRDSGYALPNPRTDHTSNSDPTPSRTNPSTTGRTSGTETTSTSTNAKIPMAPVRPTDLSFQRFDSVPGRFRVEFPGFPKQETEDWGSGVKGTVFIVRLEENYSFQVGYGDFTAFKPKVVDRLQSLKNIRASYRPGGEFLDEKELTLGDEKIPVLEYKVGGNGSFDRERILSARDHLYLITVRTPGDKQFVVSKEVDRFFDSFDLINP